MIGHYLKIAFRNLRKYRNQTLVSVIGLATGFACFAMAALWIRYEMSYDSFHKNADRIYCVSTPDVFATGGISRKVPYPLAGYLKATFPEIAGATAMSPLNAAVEVEGIKHDNMDFLDIDSSFFSMFDVKLVEGSMDFLIYGAKKAAVTREKARQLFGKESPLGKRFKRDNDEYTVCAVVTGLPKRSNYPFDFLQAIKVQGWNYGGSNTLVEIAPGVDIAAFKLKLYEHKMQANHRHVKVMALTPLTSVRYEDPNIVKNVQFHHIILFAVAGSLLILCTLFNSLTLFVSRFRIRRRELALRTVYGASGRSLFAMLSVEFLMSLSIALLLGMFFIRLVLSPFREISGVKPDLSAIYLESAVYIAAVTVIALSAFLVTLAVFKRRTLSANIRGNRKMFRKASIVVQLIISIVFAFCTTLILKQMYHLHNADLGFAFKNRGSVYIPAEYEQIKVLNRKIEQIPEIEESLSGYPPLLPASLRGSLMLSKWDGKQEGEEIIIESINISEQYVKYYELKLVEGAMLSDDGVINDVLINESAAKAFGWNEPVGKTFNQYRVTGVLKDVCNMSPTIAAKPHFYRCRSTWPVGGDGTQPYILFKYNEGSEKICMEKIRKIITEEFPGKRFEIYSAEEEYDKFLKSENTLLAILTLISTVCIIVCVFGFVSMVSLACEERRKEIAIRKVNGATVKDILDIFFREHLTLLVAGALIAFPAGYLIMKRWLEDYVVQTEISAWIYVSILLALIMAIVLCVGGQVYRTSRENPINAINNN